MAHRQVRHQQHQRHPLLEVEYDEAHRAHALSEESREELQPFPDSGGATRLVVMFSLAVCHILILGLLNTRVGSRATDVAN